MKYFFGGVLALVGLAWLTIALTSATWRPWVNGAGIVGALAYAFVVSRDV